MTSSLLMKVEPHAASQLDEAGERSCDIGDIEDSNRPCRAQARDAEGHCNAMIPAAVDLAAAEYLGCLAAREAHAVGQNAVLDAEGLQAGAHRSDAIALLDAQLLGPRDQGRAARASGRNEQHRKLDRK